MDDLKKIDKDTLVDMLSRYTQQYMRLFRDGANKEEYQTCKDIMARLTREIEIRNRKKESSVDGKQQSKKDNRD